MTYEVSRPPPGDAAGLRQYLYDELRAIAGETSQPAPSALLLKKLYAPPPRLREGLTVLADGATWNPGAGAGVYTYYGGAWNRLG